MREQLSRRRVLGGLAGAGALGALTACGHSAANGAPGSPSPSPALTVSDTPTASPDSPAPSAPTAADWAALAAALSGSLELPADAGYNAARELFNRRFDAVLPAAVAGARTAADVVTCLKFATAHGLALTARSGGHSYLGASTGTGLVIDLRPMSAVSVDVAAGTATIGAGVALVDVYTQLAAAGVSIPAGSCPAVGVAGLTLGGGMGVVARRYGLSCDRLVAAEVVLADATVVSASASTNPDLFWALRGGGASFGIITAFTFATHPTESLATFYYSWAWTHAAAVMDAWQRTLPGAPDALWSTCHLLATADKGATPTVTVAGVYVGAGAELDTVLAPFLAHVGAQPQVSSVADHDYLEVMMIEAGCADTSTAACHVAGQSPAGTLSRDAFVAASDYFAAPIPAAGLSALVAAVAARQANPALQVGGVGFDTWGGVVNTVAPTATAFVHRTSLFAAQYTASWGEQPGDGPEPANQQSLTAIRGSVSRYANGECYQNYADPTLSAPLTAYYGENLARLQATKTRYDPTNRFAPPQGIVPEG